MHQYLLFTLTLLFLFACNKEDDGPINPVDQLPPATQTGVGMMACLIDGEPWVNSPDGLGFQGIRTTVSGPPRPGLSIIGKYDPDRTGTNSQTVLFKLHPIQEGRIEVDSADYSYIIRSPGLYHRFWPNTNRSNYVDVTYLDVDDRIISGTFEIVVFDSETQDSVTITEGR